MASRPSKDQDLTRRGAAALAGSLILSAALTLGAQAAPASAPGTIGLVLADWRFALHETPNGKVECPDGFQYDLTANYQADFPTPEARKAREETFGYFTNRGPNGENVYFHPEVIEDRLPFRAAQGTISYGMNLDGDVDGKGGGAVLPHGNFTSPDGEKGVDNQLYRVIGCTPGWRKNGGIVGPVSLYVRTETQPRVLLEISGVDDEMNDPDVTVVTYRGRDQVASDTQDKLIPWLSQRIDYVRGQRYIHRLKGKIVDGVLITEPADILLPSYERPGRVGERDIRKARLRVKLTATGGEGLLGGYVDLEHWYLMYAKTWGAHKVADIEGWSGPATYRAMKEFADYRDPNTGELGLSAAYHIEFTRTFIVHSAEGDQRVADRTGPLPGAAAPPRVASR